MSTFKKQLYFALIALAITSHLHAMAPSSSLDLDALNVVTYEPRPYRKTSYYAQGGSFAPIADALNHGNRTNLDNTYALISGKNIELSSTLPENCCGTIYLNVTPLICSAEDRGYPIRGAYEMYCLYKAGVIRQGVGVSYCPPNYTRATFNFGQKDDQKNISALLNAIAEKNPQAKIVPMGICAGATGILNTLAGSKLSEAAQKNITAVVLQSPAISAGKVWKDISNSYLPWGMKWLFPLIAPRYYTNCGNYKAENDVLVSYKEIPTHISFMIGKLAHDWVTPTESVRKIETALEQSNHAVTVFESDDATIRHGHLAPNGPFKAAVKQFLAKQKLDHNAQ